MDDAYVMTRGGMRDFIREYINKCDILGISYSKRNEALWAFSMGELKYLPHEILPKKETRNTTA